MADKEGASPLMLKKKSRSSRFSSWTGDANRLRDKVFRSFYIFLLIAIDFVMFVYSINGRLLEDGSFNKAITMILGGVLAGSFVVIFCLSFSRTLQNAVCAVVTTLVTVAFFNQFALFDVSNFLETWFKEVASWLTFICFIPSSWMIGLLLGIIIFFAFRYSDAILFITLVLLFSGAIGVQKNEMIKQSSSEYTEVKSLANVGSGGKSELNIVYLMIPKFPSYQFLNSTGDLAFRDLRDLLLGFYVVNQFEIYPNAFVQYADPMENLIDIFNQVDYTSATSANREYAEYLNKWDFVHGSLEKLSLEENLLFEYLKKNGYGVSMYAMPQFNFCLKAGEFNTNRCVVKGYKTVSLFDKKASTEKNVYALLGEWMLSIKNRDLNSFAKTFINMSSLRGVKVLAENRRVSVEGADQLLDRLGSDFVRDKGDQAYLAYIDLPSDMFIYDEFCNIKPRKDWVALNNNTVLPGRPDEKKQAYIEQTKCLIGKLQEYMDTVLEQKKIANTNIFIQGISSARELGPRAADKYNQFVNDKLVNLAVRRGDNPRFLVNANICLASDFTKTLMRYQDYCYTLDDMKMPKDELFSMKKNLINNAVIRSNRISNIVDGYRAWYENYKSKNVSYQKRMAQQKKETLARQMRQKAIEQREKEMVNSSEAARPSSDNIFELTDEVVEDNSEVMSEEEFKNDVMSEDKPSEPTLPQSEIKDEKASPAMDVLPVANGVVEAPTGVKENTETLSEKETPADESSKPTAVEPSDTSVVEAKEVASDEVKESPMAEPAKTEAAAEVKESAADVKKEEVVEVPAAEVSEDNLVKPEIVTDPVKEDAKQVESVVEKSIEVKTENAVLPEISNDVVPVVSGVETDSKADTDKAVTVENNTAESKKTDKADELDLF